jgi:biopolymer transport protein ExbD
MAVKLEKGSALSSLSLTPLIDIVFLLLIFFLVATRFAEEERELDVVLPSASEAKPLSAKPREVFVNIDKEGAYFVHSKVVDLIQLEDILAQASADNPGTQSVIIRADEACSWKFVVAVMNLCNKVNIMDYKVSTAKT